MKITKKDLASIKKELFALLSKYTNIAEEYPDFFKSAELKQSSDINDTFEIYYCCKDLPFLHMYLSQHDDYCIASLEYTCSMIELSTSKCKYDFVNDQLICWVEDMRKKLYLQEKEDIYSNKKIHEEIPTLLKVHILTLIGQTQIITNCVKNSFEQKLIEKITQFKHVHTYKSSTTDSTIFTYLSK